MCNQVEKSHLPLLAAPPCAASTAYFPCIGLHNRVEEKPFPYSRAGTRQPLLIYFLWVPVRIKDKQRKLAA